MERLAATATTVRFVALVPTVPARVDPLPPVGRQCPAPATVVIAGIVWASEGKEAVVAEKAMMVQAVRAVESGAGKARPERRCADETRTTKMCAAEMSTAADGGKGHSAAMHATTKAAAVSATTAMPTATSGQGRGRKRDARSERRCHETCEEFVCHRKILRH
jgi:hypothetical protein